jgi:hypothetical protein
LLQKAVGLLDKDAGAVPGGFVAAAGAPVGEVYQDLQGILNQCVGFMVVDVADHAHATGVVLECRAVEAFNGWADQALGAGGHLSVTVLSFKSCPNGNNAWVRHCNAHTSFDRGAGCLARRLIGLPGMWIHHLIGLRETDLIYKTVVIIVRKKHFRRFWHQSVRLKLVSCLTLDPVQDMHYVNH